MLHASLIHSCCKLHLRSARAPLPTPGPCLLLPGRAPRSVHALLGARLTGGRRARPARQYGGGTAGPEPAAPRARNRRRRTDALRRYRPRCAGDSCRAGNGGRAVHAPRRPLGD